MKINPYIFRGYDVRGLVDKDLNPQIVEHLGKAYGTFLLKRGIKKTVLGRDCRLSSQSYSRAMIKGVLSTGVDAIDVGLALVGTIYWAQHYFNVLGCVSVSGSHNRAEYNGFKFGTGLSQTMESREVQELREIAERGVFKQGRGKVEKKDVKEVYFNDLLKRFALPLRFKVVVDPGHGTAGAFAPALLERAGCQVVCNHCQLDGAFPLGAPDPTEKKMAERLAKKVLESRANLGFSYDSDGDRIGIVDDKGNIIWNDVLLALFALEVLREHPGATIIYNALCSKAVEETILKYGGKPFMWRVGHSFLKKKNQEVGAAFIGELSGHFFFSADFYNHDDGLYSTLRLLNYLTGVSQSLSEAVSSLPKYISSSEIKIYCPDDKKVGLINKVSSVLKKDFSAAEIINDERVGDGVRINFADSMFVIRYSQNAPYLTVKFEAKIKERYDFLKDYIRRLLSGYEEIDWQSPENVNLNSLT